MTSSAKVAILGAGFGGLGLGAQLKASGEDSFVILERAGRIGRTWRDNSYPGCACDVPSHLYWYSFDDQPEWTRVYSPQSEILGKLECFARRRQVTPHIRFNSEVTAARWDEQASAWHIETRSGDTVQARALVAAWGQLNPPKLPDIEGCESFAGCAFHSAQWRHDAVLDGKRVGCIGNGASAIQIIPEIAARAGRLSVFQRSASYVVPRVDRAYTEEELRLFAGNKQAQLDSREAIYVEHERWFHAMHPGTDVANEFIAMARAHLESQVADPVLRERLWPDYPIGCKRILLSDDFYPAMVRPNVELITDRIACIEPAGVRTADGRMHEVDALVYATGFETRSFLGTSDIVGRAGKSLRNEWQDGASAYLGITVAGFPNFFMLYGPNTNLGHNSIIAMLECQFGYVLNALRIVDQRRASMIEVRPDAMRRFNDELQTRLRDRAWAGGCTSWYKIADGRVTNNWCGGVEDYKAETADVRIDDYELMELTT